MSLRVSFNPTNLRPDEQDNIKTLCEGAWAHPALKSSTEAIVYSAPPPPNVRGRVWWHTTDNDSKEHITVRYNRRANRVHIYRDGTVNVSPQKPTARVVAAGTGESEEGYDSVPEFSDEEWDE